MKNILFSLCFFTCYGFAQDSDSCSEVSITASSTEVCAGESVDITVDSLNSDFSNWATSEPNNLALGTEHFGLFLSTGRWNDGPDSYTSANCIIESENNLGVVSNFTFMGVFENHYYYLYNQSDGWTNCNNLAASLGGYLAIINSQLETNFIVSNLPSSYDRGWIGMYQDTNHPDYSEPGGAWFWLDGTPVPMTSNTTTFTWSTGDTTANSTVTPTETTEYWVDVTTNGITCREYITINVTAPASPTGDIEQTFCESSTISDLSADGNNIQWYDAPTAGNQLDSSTPLIDNQTVYASQTINGCESNQRLAVTISIMDIQITATATEVCAGESVDLFVDDLASPNHYYYMYVNGYPDTTAATDFPIDQIPVNGPNSEFLTFAGTPGSANTYNLIGNLDNIMLWNRALNADEVQQVYQNDECNILNLSQSIQTNLIGYWPFCNSNPNGFTLNGQLTSVVDGAQSSSDRNGNSNSAYYFDGNSKITIEGTNNINSEFNFLENSFTISYWIKSSILPIGDSHIYTVWKQSGHGSNQVGYNLSINPTNNFDHRVGSSSNWGVVNSDFEVQTEQWYHVTHVWNGLITANEISYLWSTGDITENITVTPTETTEYWVDVTTNGITCREYITINVTAPPAPTGNAVGEACSDLTVGTNNNSFNGENILWYDSIDSQTPLSDDTLLVDGTIYYISQTVDGCESIDRFEILILAPLPTITIDNPIICEGESTTVSVSTNPFLGTVTYLWNSDENETSDFIITAPTESGGGWVDVSLSYEYEGGIVQNLCRYFYSITVQDAPEPPVSGGDITECETIVAQNLEATASVSTGQTIVWYDAASGGNVVIDPSLSAAGTATYYAETINDDSGCSSLSRTSVTLTITSIAAPTGDSVQSFCNVSTIADLMVAGDNIQWYDSSTGDTLLDQTTVLSDGQLVYASQTENECESIDRLGVSVEIDIITDPILLTTELDFCLAREATLADLEIDAQGFELEWYDSFSGGTILAVNTLLEDNVSYYATLYDVASGCESLMRLEVVPIVIPCEVIIFNAISINDNGLNDYMVIENAEYFPFNSLEIFNRDGHLIYSQKKYGVGDSLFRGVANVDGIYSKGSNLPTGSYLYVFTYYNPYSQEYYTKKGFLTINSN